MKNILLSLVFCITLIGCNTNKVAEEPNVFYTCSMDPQVMEKKPGKCPICKMELTRTVISPTQDKESIQLSETQIKLGNITTHKITIGNIGNGLKLRGTIVQNERNITSVTSRVPGRVDKLYFKIPGEKVEIGDHIYDIYSEELQAAIQQYLLLKEKERQLSSANVNYSEMMKSAQDKLLVWGLSEWQIKQLSQASSNKEVPFYSKVKGLVSEILISEGDYVNEGSPILQVSDYSSLWVEAEVYPQHISIIKPGVKVTVRTEAFPDDVLEGKIDFVNPELQAQSRINMARIEIPNNDKKYKPGMRATVTVLLKEFKSLTVPESAVLYQPEMNLVWVKNDKGNFVPKMVEIGSVSNGSVEVKSGLKEGEEVVVFGAYLIDSEYRLRKGSGEMPGMNHGDGTVAPLHQH